MGESRASSPAATFMLQSAAMRPRRPRQQEQTQKSAREAAKKKKHQVFFSFADRSLLCLLTRCFSELFSPCFFQFPFRSSVRFWFPPLTEELFSFD
jgi:hypothetical protein